MRKTLKVLSALLTYPTAELQAAVPEMRAALDAENRLPQKNRHRIDRILEELANGDLFDLQERYVLLFDRTRSLSLHLFEHVHGESRDRGQAMVDLKALYERHGLFMSSSELPDHLPLFLEFLSAIPGAEACELLGDTGHVLEAIRQRLISHINPQVSAAGWRVYDQYLKANRIEAGAASYADVVRLILGTKFGDDWKPRLR